MIRPMGEFAVVEPIEEEVHTGVIIVPDTVKKRPTRGTVLAVGPGRLAKDGTFLPVEVHIDEVVLFSEYVAKEITFNDRELLLIKASDIHAVLEGEDS